MSKLSYFKQLSLEWEQFQCQKQFYYKQSSFTFVRSLHEERSLSVKTILFQPNQF